MRKSRRTLALLLVFVTCFSIYASALAATDDETISMRSTLTLSNSLSSSQARARGRSTQTEYLTVTFKLYQSNGSYITSASGSGYSDVTASVSVSLSPGSYKMVSTVTNGSTSLTRTSNFTI